jgi:hypothetical protein
MKRRRQTGKARRTLKTAAVKTQTMVSNVNHPRPGRYSTARGRKPVKLPPQEETAADYGDSTGYPLKDAPEKRPGRT